MINSSQRPLPIQHTTNRRDKNPCLQRDSSPQSQQSSGRRHATETARPSGSTCRLRLKCDGTCAENRFRLSAKRTNPFKSAGASVQSTTGSRGVRISGSNVGYVMFRGSVKSTGYPLHSPVSSSLTLPCVTVSLHISTGLYECSLKLVMSLQAVSSSNVGIQEVFGLNLRKNTNILSVLDISRQVPLENLKSDHDKLSSSLFANVQQFGAISVTDSAVKTIHTYKHTHTHPHIHTYSTGTTKAHH